MTDEAHITHALDTGLRRPVRYLLLRPDAKYQCYGSGTVPLEYSSYEEALAACDYLANDYAVTGLTPVEKPRIIKYFLKADFHNKWTEVSKEQWITAERAAGFRPKLPSYDPENRTTCATGYFGGNGVSGKIV